MGVKGKKDYMIGIQFKMQHMLFNAQMKGYLNQLNGLDIKLESIFKWFFEVYLCDEFNAKGFVYNTPSDNTTELEKCKLLASEIDSILKQFTFFVADGYIDRDLFEISSNHLLMRDIPSFCKEKYIYANNKVCKDSMWLLFSDQSTLTYTNKTKSTYHDFCSILQNEKMNINDFFDYQKPTIHWLEQHDCITIEDNELINVNIQKVSILKDLYHNQASCLPYLRNYQMPLIRMLNADEIFYGSSLFSKPEQSYLNYVLNRSEFSNGYDLRNKYIHGTHSLQTKEHEADYIELLKIMVLIIIKINEEFCLREK